MRRPCSSCEVVMMSRWEWERTPPTQRATSAAHRGHGLCRSCYESRNRTPVVTREALLEDIADLLEQEPTTTLAGLALRLGRSRDSITLAMRRSAREGDRLAAHLRERLIA